MLRENIEEKKKKLRNEIIIIIMHSTKGDDGRISSRVRKCAWFEWRIEGKCKIPTKLQENNCWVRWWIICDGLRWLELERKGYFVKRQNLVDSDGILGTISRTYLWWEPRCLHGILNDDYLIIARIAFLNVFIICGTATNKKIGES